nr:PspA/IM30 family protein [Lysinibacillus timonensis]
MGIFKRVKTMTKARIHGMLDGLEDPIAMLNEYTREMEQEMINARKALARQMFAENKHLALITETKDMIAKRTRQAKLAIEHGEVDIAKLAVEEKIIHEKHLTVYQQQYEEIQEQTNMLKEHVKELQVALTDLHNRKMLLASRANVAQSIQRIQKATAPFESENILKGIAKVEDRILLMEAEAKVSSPYSSSLLLDGYYQSHVNEEEIYRELEKLKGQKEIGHNG